MHKGTKKALTIKPTILTIRKCIYKYIYNAFLTFFSTYTGIHKVYDWKKRCAASLRIRSRIRHLDLDPEFFIFQYFLSWSNQKIKKSPNIWKKPGWIRISFFLVLRFGPGSVQSRPATPGFRRTTPGLVKAPYLKFRAQKCSIIWLPVKSN